MPALHIRDAPEEIVETLKQRARRNHRSLQKEILHILVSAAREDPPATPLPPMKLKLSRASGAARWRREELYSDDGR
jgi:plasmid stability protein